MKPDLIEKYYKSPADNFGGEMNGQAAGRQDRKSTRLNSSHSV